MSQFKDDDYRATAQRYFGAPSAKVLGRAVTVMPVEVSPVASVHRTVGGAFVELEVWVPDVAVETGDAKQS